MAFSVSIVWEAVFFIERLRIRSGSSQKFLKPMFSVKNISGYV
jgi:hypothetical protein